MDIKNDNHLIVMTDYYSRWSEVAVIKNTAASKVIQHITHGGAIVPCIYGTAGTLLLTWINFNPGVDK